MSAVIVAEYDCGHEYEIPLTPAQRQIRSRKIRDQVYGDLAKILHARHERECETCYPHSRWALG